jgi:hypothetical protein
MLGASADPEVARGFLDVMTCLALPSEVLNRPGMCDRLAAVAQTEAPAALRGPTREQLIALAQ